MTNIPYELKWQQLKDIMRKGKALFQRFNATDKKFSSKFWRWECPVELKTSTPQIFSNILVMQRGFHCDILIAYVYIVFVTAILVRSYCRIIDKNTAFNLEHKAIEK